MIRKLTLIAMAAALVLPVTTAWATSCHSDAKAQEPRCDVDRTCENLDNGIRCTIKAKGETTEAQVRECVRRCHGAASPAEGVTVEITDIAGGVVVTTTASDAEMVNHLQEHGGVCAKAGAGHHAEGHKCAGHQAEGHKCAGHGEDHASAGDQAEGHKCAGHGEAKAQEPRCDVDHACQNLDNGVRCTIKAKGDTTEAQVRECVRRCHGAAAPAEGVTVEITDVEGGAVVTATASDAEMVKHLQEHAEFCGKAGSGCCAGHQAEGHKCCAGHGEGHKCAGHQAEGHKCAGHGDDKPAEPKGCPHATGAGAEAPTPAPQPQAGG